MTNKSIEAWDNYCDRMKMLGRKMLSDDFPNDSDRDQAEGVRHLSRQMTLAMNLYMEADNPEFPRWIRHDDDVTQWGGNNLDNGYLYARVEESGTYRIYGNASSVSGFIVSAREGWMHYEQMRVKDLSSEDMQINEDGSFELIVSRDKQEGNWLEMISGTTQLGIRVYYYDWENETPPVFHIVKVGNEGRVQDLLNSNTVITALDKAAEWTEISMLWWNEWIKASATRQPVNAISEPHSVPGGSNDVITYSGGRFDLQPDEALVVTLEPIKAEYLGIMFYTDAWFETADMMNRLGGFNNYQLVADGDGRIRVVFCGTDIRVSNWVDIEERQQGLLTLRTINGDAPPQTSSQVVKIDDLKSVLPNDTQWLTEDQRKQQVMVRREHISSRFHR